MVRWTPNATTLGIGMIRDNGASVGINAAPSHAMLYTNSTRAAADSAIGETVGVYGTTANTNGFGLFGNNSSTNGVGIGATGDTAISAYGTKYGITAYSSNIGISVSSGNIAILSHGTGFGISASGGNYGGEFTSPNGIGAYGAGGSKGGYFIGTKGQGVYGSSNTAAGDSSIGKTYGVYAITSDVPGSFAAVYGADNSTSGGYGVEGIGYTDGVYGNGHYNGVYGTGGNYGVYGTGPDAGVYGQGANFGGGLGVEGVGYNASIPNWPTNTGNAFSGTSYGVYAEQTTNTNTGVAAIYAKDAKTSGNVQVNAWSAATHYKILGSYAGSVSCAVPDLNGDKVILHCPETPEFYFEDYGEGQLVNGKARIDLDPILAKNVAINEKHHLRVFIQLDGDCKGVYVTNKTTTGFDVIELNGGSSNTPFEWHIICNVKDENEGGVVNHNQDLRFEKAPVIKMYYAKTDSVLKVPPAIVPLLIKQK